MRPWETLRIGIAAVALLCAGSGIAQAALITGFGTILAPGSGSAGPTGLNPAPNNDNTVAPSANAMGANFFFTSLQPVDIEFVVANSGGTTEYFFTDIFTNVDTLPWLGFTMELGFGTGADFVRVPGTVGLDFDMPNGDPQPTSSVYSDLDHLSNVIRWTGGTVNPLVGGSGAPFTVIFTFSFDVPDGLASLHPQGLNRFTLRQTPLTTAVPEPASAALFGFGLALAALRRRNRR
jgi:hypothetical protein